MFILAFRDRREACHAFRKNFLLENNASKTQWVSFANFVFKLPQKYISAPLLPGTEVIDSLFLLALSVDRS